MLSTESFGVKIAQILFWRERYFNGLKTFSQVFYQRWMEFSIQYYFFVDWNTKTSSCSVEIINIIIIVNLFYFVIANVNIRMNCTCSSKLMLKNLL